MSLPTYNALMIQNIKDTNICDMCHSGDASILLALWYCSENKSVCKETSIYGTLKKRFHPLF